MKKNISKYAKIAGIICGIVVALVAIFNICIYNFVFLPNFSRATKERTVEHEIKFYAGEENYKRHLADSEYIDSLNLPLIEITSFDSLKLKALVWNSENSSSSEILLTTFVTRFFVVFVTASFIVFMLFEKNPNIILNLLF